MDKGTDLVEEKIVGEIESRRPRNEMEQNFGPSVDVSAAGLDMSARVMSHTSCILRRCPVDI